VERNSKQPRRAQSKVLPLERAYEVIDGLKQQGQRIVFTGLAQTPFFGVCDFGGLIYASMRRSPLGSGTGWPNSLAVSIHN